MREIQLVSGKGIAIVDDEDYDKVSKYKWYLHNIGNGYAITNSTNCEKTRKSLKMHHLINKPPKGYVIDHINHNGLDNRKCNLRICTTGENIRNQESKSGSSEFKGVSLRKDNKKWAVHVCLDYNDFSLGQFNSEVEAAIMYNLKAKELHGEFACLNKISKDDLDKYLPIILNRNFAKSRKGTSKYRGVSWKEKNKGWQSQICFNKKVIYLGMFKDEKDAAEAYNEKAKELYKDKAKLNKIGVQ